MTGGRGLAPGHRRPWAGLLAVVLAAAAILAACGGAQGSGANGSRQPGDAGGTPAGQSAGVVYWAALDLAPGPIPAYVVDPEGRPLLAAPGASATWLRRLVHAGLMNVGPGGRLLPGLAQGHVESDDALTHRFALRAGASYADGTPVTGGDVIRSWRRYLDLHPEAAGRVAAMHFDAAGQEVVLTLTEPAGWVVRALALAPVTPPDRETGAGPFRATGEAADRWILERLGAGEGDEASPLPDRIEVAPVEASALGELIQRRVDLISGLSGRQVSALRAAWEASGYRAFAVPGGWRLAVLINPLRRPLDNPEIRRALAAALDRQAVAEALDDARALPGEGAAPPLDQALHDAGYDRADGRWTGARGSVLELALVAPDGLWADFPPGTAAAAADALASGLRRRGLEVHVQILAADAFLRRVYEHRAFDLALVPLPLDETGQTYAVDVFLDVGAVPPLPIAPGIEATLVELAEPVIWVLDRSDSSHYRLDEAAGLVLQRLLRQETHD